MRLTTHVVLRFVLELAALVAAAIAGASAGSPPFGLAGLLAGVVLFAVVWGLWIAPRARFPLAPIARFVVGTALMLAVAIAVVLVADPVIGEILVAAILANAIALAVTGGLREPEVPR